LEDGALEPVNCIMVVLSMFTWRPNSCAKNIDRLNIHYQSEVKFSKLFLPYQIRCTVDGNPVTFLLLLRTVSM
jgi:hypothetical protein